METLERFLLVSAIVIFIYVFYRWLLRYLRRKEIQGSFPYVYPFDDDYSKLKFELKAKGLVTVELYSEDGKSLIKSLYSEELPIATHEIPLDLNTQSGKYELRITFPNQVTKRVVELWLIKEEA